MEVLTRLVEGAVFLVCVGLVVRRYDRPSVRIVPGDLLLLTAALFLVAPLALDALGFVNPYRIYPEMRVAFDDPLSRVLAACCALLTVIAALVATRWAERRDTASTAPPPQASVWYRRLLLGGAFLPLLLVAVAPDPRAYATFAAPFVLRGAGQAFADPDAGPAQFNVLVTWATYLSCVSFALWAAATRGRWALLLAPLILVMDLWINGKRHIAVLFLLAVGFALVSSRPIHRRLIRRGAVGGLLVVVLAFVASNVYQSVFRPQNRASGNATEIFLTDFSRLDVLRLSIASQSGLDVPRPLDYAGQSPVLHLEAVGLDLGGGPLVSYADRVTAAAQGQYPRPLRGSLTTSLVSETIDNIGLLGVIVGPALMGLLAIVVSLSADPLLRLVGGLAVATLLVVHVLAVLPIVGVAVLRLVQLAVRHGRARYVPASSVSPHPSP